MQQLLRSTLFLFVIILFQSTITAEGQVLTNNPEDFIFMKRELNAGFKFYVAPEREGLRTDETMFRFEQTMGAAMLRIENLNYVFLPSRQDQWKYSIEFGPIMGKGEFSDSSAIKHIDANTSPAGLRANAEADFTNRYYWDERNYTLLSIKAWGQYDVYRRNASGTLIDSNNVSLPYEDDSNHRKLRYGFQAKAGWGIGRLNPVNHYAASQRLLEFYYPGRIFSAEEIRAVARAIGQIKHQREIKTVQSSENEVSQLTEFLNQKLLLEVPSELENNWLLTEFRPRFQGSRLEAGPFFNYFNREPDFVYGGYIRYENHKYCNLNLNRSISAGMKYNGYKNDDWITFEATAGWNWYPSFRHEIGFGVRYLPGMIFKNFNDLQPLRHAVIPYLEYYSQLNSRYRIETAFAYRIARENEFVMPGPELSVSIYRSRY